MMPNVFHLYFRNFQQRGLIPSSLQNCQLVFILCSSISVYFNFAIINLKLYFFCVFNLNSSYFFPFNSCPWPLHTPVSISGWSVPPQITAHWCTATKELHTIAGQFRGCPNIASTPFPTKGSYVKGDAAVGYLEKEGGPLSVDMASPVLGVKCFCEILLTNSRLHQSFPQVSAICCFF